MVMRRMFEDAEEKKNLSDRKPLSSPSISPASSNGSGRAEEREGGKATKAEERRVVSESRLGGGGGGEGGGEGEESRK